MSDKQFFELSDGSFIEIDYEGNILHFTNNFVHEVSLQKPDESDEEYEDTQLNRYELGIRLEFNSRYTVKQELRQLNDLPQYHFIRDEMTKIFEEVFPLDSEEWDWDPVWMCEFGDTSSFHCFKDADTEEYYILHKYSGTMINWYKHMGRTNTCNKNLSLDELKLFLLLLRKELVEEKIIEPELQSSHVSDVGVIGMNKPDNIYLSDEEKKALSKLKGGESFPYESGSFQTLKTNENKGDKNE